MKQVLDLLDDDDFQQADVFILTPVDGAQSEEDSGDDDEMTVNNLSGRQLAEEADAIVRHAGYYDYIGQCADEEAEYSTGTFGEGRSKFSSNPTGSEADIEQNTSNVSKASSLSSVAVGPTGETIRCAKSTATRPAVKRCLVRKDLEPDILLFPSLQRAFTSDVNPISLLESFFDDEIWEFLAEMTNL